MVRLLNLICYRLALRWLADGAEGRRRAAGAAAAASFGVFCWLEVTGFGFALFFFIFLCFVLHITF